MVKHGTISSKGNRYKPNVVYAQPISQGLAQPPNIQSDIQTYRSNNSHQSGKEPLTPQNLPHRQATVLPGTLPSSRQQPLFASNKMNDTSISSNSNFTDSTRHMSGYRHVHLVRAPSGLESSGQMQKFSDEKSIGGFFNPNLNLRRTASIHNNNLEGIKEESAFYH